MKKIFIISVSLIIIILTVTYINSKLTWEPGWKQIPEPSAVGETASLLRKADKLINEADNEEKLRDLISTYEKVLKIDPSNYEVLWSLGRYYILMGCGYADSKKEKKDYYLKALHYCERGMYTNIEFKELIDRGEKFLEAAKVLTKKEIAAMFYWYAGIGWIYTECFSQVEKITNLSMASATRKMTEYMMNIDPDWAGGHPYSAWASYYAVMPSIFGGDLKKSAEFYDKAIKSGPNWLYIKYARAHFLYTKTKDRKAFESDLKWVLAQDPHKADSPYPWNVFFQRKAKEKLANADSYFQ